MLLHDALSTSPRSRPVRLQACPQCGELLLAPLMAEHVGEGHVRNHWVCEACGHTFRKSHRFEFAGADDDHIIA